MQPNQDTGFFDDDNDLNYGQDQQETQRARDKQDEVTMDTTIGTQPVQLPTSAQLPVDVQNTNTANLPLHQDFNRPNDHGPVSRMEFNELREQGNAVVCKCGGRLLCSYLLCVLYFSLCIFCLPFKC